MLAPLVGGRTVQTDALFHALLARRPELVRLELTRAFFLMAEDTLARRRFEQVRAGNPPARVALDANRFL